MSVPFVVVADLEHPELTRDDRHHLERVLRKRNGDEVELTDGRGGRRRARFGAIVEPVGPIVHEPRPTPLVTVAFCPVKGDRPEWAVQKLTELGVDRIVAIEASRSVVRWDAVRRSHALERWQRVAREAVTQCRRSWMPEIVGPLDLGQAIEALGPVALAAPGGAPVSLRHPAILIGPEGGWTDEELEAAPATVGLGPHVLRTETAAVTAGALLSALREGIVSERS